MKLEIAPEILATELSAIRGILTAKMPLNICEYVLIETAGKYIKLLVSNGVSSAESYAPLDSADGEFALCLNAAKLSELVRLLSGGLLEITLDEASGHAMLKHGKSKWKMLGVAAAHFPKADDKWSDPIDVPGKHLKTLIGLTHSFIGDDDSRFAYSGGLMRLSPTGMSLVGTDGQRLSFANHECEVAVQDEVSVLLPHKALKQLRDMIDTDVVKIAFSRHSGGINKVKFRVGSRFLTTVLTTGQFPDVSRALEANAEVLAEVFLEKTELHDALKRTLVFNDDRSRVVRFNVLPSGEEMALATDGGDNGNDVIPIFDYVPQADADAFKISLNGDHLLKFLSVVKEVSSTQCVVVKYFGENRFVEFNPAHRPDVDFRYLVAPVREVK